MIRQISIKTWVGWISGYETNGKIFKIKFGKLRKQTSSIKVPYKIEDKKI